MSLELSFQRSMIEIWKSRDNVESGNLVRVFEIFFNCVAWDGNVYSSLFANHNLWHAAY